MPNLLSVNSYHYIRGGSDAVYFNHARLFERSGWKNTFFSMMHPNNKACETEQYFADRVDFDNREGLAKTLKSSMRVIYSPQAQSRMSQLLDEHPADIAHFHCIYHHLSPSVLVEAKRRQIPTVMTAHDLKIACPAYKMMNDDGVCERCRGGKVWNVAMHRCIKGSLAASALIAVESAVHKALRLYDRHIDRIVTPSKFYRQKLIEWGWDADKIVYIPNFVDDIPQHASPPGQYLLYFGRLAPEKGLKTLIRASALSRVPVKIAGTGPEEASLKSLSAELSAPVEFVGFKSGDDLRQMIGGARAIVLPSEWYENGPMSAIEAFGEGKPLIGADIGGIPELIVEDETGWKFQPGDFVELADLLSYVQAASDQQLIRMARATREFVQARFTDAAYYTEMSKLYGELGVG